MNDQLPKGIRRLQCVSPQCRRIQPDAGQNACLWCGAFWPEVYDPGAIPVEAPNPDDASHDQPYTTPLAYHHRWQGAPPEVVDIDGHPIAKNDLVVSPRNGRSYFVMAIKGNGRLSLWNRYHPRIRNAVPGNWRVVQGRIPLNGDKLDEAWRAIEPCQLEAEGSFFDE